MEYGQRRTTATVTSSTLPGGIQYLVYASEPTLTGSRILQSAGAPIALSDTGSAIQINIDIGALTADATPDSAADYVMTYDASAAAHKKVLLSNLAGGASLSTANIAFTDGDTVRRVTITDAGVSATSKILCSVRRPDTTDASADSGFFYLANVVRIGTGEFDVLVMVLDVDGDGCTQNPPNETIVLTYTIA